MGKKTVTKNGIFIQEIVSCPTEDVNDVKNFLQGIFQRNTPSYILQELTNRANAIQAEPQPIVKTSSKKRKAQVLESLVRRKHDAAAIIEKIELVKTLLEDKNIDQAFVQAFHLGAMVQRADIRNLEPEVLKGIQNLQDASNGGNSKLGTSDEKLEQWQKDADETKQKHPSYSRWRIAGELAVMYANNHELKDYQATRDWIYRKIKMNSK